MPTDDDTAPISLTQAFDDLKGHADEVAHLIRQATPDHAAFLAATNLAKNLAAIGQQVRSDVARQIRDTHQLSLAQLAAFLDVSKAWAHQMVGPAPRRELPVRPSNPMPVHVEIWPLAADELGLWVADEGAWRAGPILADTGTHPTIRRALHDHGVADPVRLLHSTSWRETNEILVITYAAVLHLEDDELARDRWPDALPISRHLDALLPVMRHLALLVKTDSTVRDAVGEYWLRWLSESGTG
jgi:hypothetical protein